MTTKDFPLEIWDQVRREWFGQAYYDEFMLNEEDHSLATVTPDNTIPDREGGYQVDPDDDTKRFEWDTDLTPTEEALFDDIVASALAGVSKSERDTVKAEIQNLKAYYDNPSPSGSESEQAIKDIIKVLRVMWRDTS